MAELDNWIKVIHLTGETGWLSFYESSIGHPVSSTHQLNWAIDSYGEWPVIEAILAASKKKFTDDPLNYVLAVAQAKWKVSSELTQNTDRYERSVERSKNRVTQQNEELADKIEKARLKHEQ